MMEPPSRQVVTVRLMRCVQVYAGLVCQAAVGENRAVVHRPKAREERRTRTVVVDGENGRMTDVA